MFWLEGIIGTFILIGVIIVIGVIWIIIVETFGIIGAAISGLVIRFKRSNNRTTREK